MKTWRLIKSITDNGARQMAIDEAILTARIKNKVPNTLRFFTWKPTCVTIGFFQNLEEEIDFIKTRSRGIDVVRRYTGGGAVLHEHELTYSLTISEKDVSSDIVESYKEICAGIIEALFSLGIKAEFKPINDIIVGNKKISGNAQTRKSGVVLQHGTILLDLDLKKMFSLLKIPDEKIKDKMIKAAKERVTSLKNELGKSVANKEIEKALIYGFEKMFNIKTEVGELTPQELKHAEKLYKEKYTNNKWTNWR
ncbi:MAG: biotin/lipoate A/B protein ligase family protein [Patescibacteria group bacterium]|nr:biotin/lipoate A/B protein ligase family protein [Patescibacteria group bacterium]